MMLMCCGGGTNLAIFLRQLQGAFLPSMLSTCTCVYILVTIIGLIIR
jgi:hypothetical protein